VHAVGSFDAAIDKETLRVYEELDAGTTAGRQWQAVYEFRPVDGYPLLRRVELRWVGGDPRAGITTRLLRTLNIPRAYDVARDQLKEFFEETEGQDYREALEQHLEELYGAHADEALQSMDVPKGAPWPFRQAYKPDATRRGPGRPPVPDTEFLSIAVAYAELMDEGCRRPNIALSERLHMSPDVVAEKVREARRRELLTAPPRPGVAGGKLTPKAIALRARPEAQS
jgi:hypothetical protein